MRIKIKFQEVRSNYPVVHTLDIVDGAPVPEDEDPACYHARTWVDEFSKQRSDATGDEHTYVLLSANKLPDDVRIAGKDGYGIFYSMTGHEDEGHCFWCGAEVRPGRRYCKGHRLLYLKHFEWSYARLWCLERAGNKCGNCGKKRQSGESLEVHHIKPIDSGFRSFTQLNRPENLIALCHECHRIETAKQRTERAEKERVEAGRLRIEAARRGDQGYMDFFFEDVGSPTAMEEEQEE